MEEQTARTMWDIIGDGANNFVTNIVTPVMDVATNNEICLAFVAVTFVGLGVRCVRKIVGALGRGR